MDSTGQRRRGRDTRHARQHTLRGISPLQNRKRPLWPAACCGACTLLLAVHTKNNRMSQIIFTSTLVLTHFSQRARLLPTKYYPRSPGAMTARATGSHQSHDQTPKLKAKAALMSKANQGQYITATCSSAGVGGCETPSEQIFLPVRFRVGDRS